MANENSSAANAASSKKPVELNQLYIVRSYVDEKTADIDKSAVGTEGTHGLRVNGGKLQYLEKGLWQDVTVTADGLGGSGVNGKITSDDMDDAIFATDEEVRKMFS